jgi:hypothetical protein
LAEEFEELRDVLGRMVVRRYDSSEGRLLEERLARCLEEVRAAAEDERCR